MKFESIHEFLNMGGYGFYVWSSYAIVMVAFIGLNYAAYQRHESIKASLVRMLKRQ